MNLKKLNTRFQIILLISFIAFSPGTFNELNAQGISRDYDVSLLINQVGYIPQAGKYCVTKGDIEMDFEVIDLKTLEVAHKGTLAPMKGDFGSYLKGDFSKLTAEGHYFVKTNTKRSYPFEISANIYEAPIDLIVSYFSRQRCGASTTGYLAPCHVDDGIRQDNGKHQDVSGGWHDASDLRKWVGATIYGMVGIAKAYELQEGRDRSHFVDELKWGNRYFLAMQEPQGFVMNYVGGDVKKHSDSNRWTDNEVGEDGTGEATFVKPTAGTSMADMLIFENNDDRVIRTDPVGLTAQYNFVTSEAILSRITKSTDSDYSKICLTAAEKCFEWCKKLDRERSAGDLGSAIDASIELFKTTRKAVYKEYAIEQAAKLEKLQASGKKGDVGGFFNTSAKNKEPYKNISRGCWEFNAVCHLFETFPDHDKAETWKTMIANYAYNYLDFLTEKNSFNLVPFGLYDTRELGGNRKTGKYMYRYFMEPELDWWVGNNALITSAGVGLLKAAEILNDDRLAHLAQRQLDWVQGANPFNYSTMIGVGFNGHKHFDGSTFLPGTPVIPGAVLNGIGGDHDDMPDLKDGSWQTCEYWTPMVAYTLWLMAEISNSESN